MNIQEKIDKYLIGEGTSIEKALAVCKKYMSSDFHEEANEVAERAKELLSNNKRKEAMKYLKGVIKKGTPQWNEEAVEAAESILSA